MEALKINSFLGQDDHIRLPEDRQSGENLKKLIFPSELLSLIEQNEIYNDQMKISHTRTYFRLDYQSVGWML